MPMIEIASFTASKYLLSDSSNATLNQAIGALKGIDGCLGVYHGSQLDDQTQAYVVIVWESYETYGRMSKLGDSSRLKDALESPGLALTDLSFQLFTFEKDPTPIIDAEISEWWFSQLKSAYTDADIVSYIQAFRARIENNEHQELTIADFPCWHMGMRKSGVGSNVFIASWESNKTRERFLRSGAFLEYLKSLGELVDWEVKPLRLTKV